MLCIQGLFQPNATSNPPYTTNRGDDPYAPPNAFPGTPTSLSNINGSNWTDSLGHVVVRNGWGMWTVYDDSQSGGVADVGCVVSKPGNLRDTGSSTCTTTLEKGGTNPPTGGSSSYGGFGDGGPFGTRPYPATMAPYGPGGNACSAPGCLAGYTYPNIDLLTMKDGVTKITTPTDWWVKRRPEIWSLVQKEIYGNAYPAYFNAWSYTGAGVASGTVTNAITTTAPGTQPAIKSWTIGSTTTGSTTGVISCSTVAGQPTNAPYAPTALSTAPNSLPTCPTNSTGNGTGNYYPSGTNANWTGGGTTSAKYTYRQRVYTATFNIPYMCANCATPYTPRTTPTMTFTCHLPTTASGKVPVVINISSSASSASTLPWGYGECDSTVYGGTSADSGGAATSDRLNGMLSGGAWRQPTDPGTLQDWAWGISRFIDFLASGADSDPNGPDPDKIAVEGHSRDGKAAMVTMVYDNRIVAGLPSCGGAGGTAPVRRHYGETVESILGTGEYWWMAGYMMNYAGAECSYYGPGLTNQIHGAPGCTPAYFPRAVADLDVDSYASLALIAPRAVMTNGGTETPVGSGDAWQDPRGMYLTGSLASPVWNLLGWTGQIIPSGTVFTTNPATWTSGESSGGPLNGGESIGGTPPLNVAFTGPNGPGGAGSATVAWRRHTAGHTDAPEFPVFAQWAAQYLWDKRPVITAGQSFTLPAGGTGTVGTVAATAGGGGPLQEWQITGATSNGSLGDGAYTFALDPNSATITVPNKAMIDPTTTSYTLSVMVGDGLLPSTKLGVDQTITINIPTDLAADGLVSVAKSGTVYNFTTKRFSQSVKITNLTQNNIPGPIALVLDDLSSNATVYNPNGVTATQLPAGSPYVNTTSLAPGASVTFTVQFTDPTLTAITYNARVLAGSVTR